MMRTLAAGIFLTALALVGVGMGTSTRSDPTPPSYLLENAAGSQEELFRRFLDALEAEDADALHTLRVTESEYKDFILAHSVPEGAPLRNLRPEVRDYAWGTLDTKSLFSERYLITEYGGREYTGVKTIEWDKGEGRYDGFRALKQLRLTVEYEGGEDLIKTGSIVELDGQYKFMSFIRD
jgi:hypothetical protein